MSEENIFRLEVDEDIAIEQVNILRNKIENSMKINPKINKVILDFSDVNRIDSSGLGFLIAISKKLKEKDGELEIVNISSKLYSFFITLKFERQMILKTA